MAPIAQAIHHVAGHVDELQASLGERRTQIDIDARCLRIKIADAYELADDDSLLSLSKEMDGLMSRELYAWTHQGHYARQVEPLERSFFVGEHLDRTLERDPWLGFELMHRNRLHAVFLAIENWTPSLVVSSGSPLRALLRSMTSPGLTAARTNLHDYATVAEHIPGLCRKQIALIFNERTVERSQELANEIRNVESRDIVHRLGKAGWISGARFT